MAVHKKQSADASTLVKTTADKKAMADKEKRQVKNKPGEIKSEPVVFSDTTTETTERIEVIEEVPAAAAAAAPSDPLTKFKEKMQEEEKPQANAVPQKNFMWPIIFIFIIALLLLGGIFIYKRGVPSKEKLNAATLSPTPTVIPTPTITVNLTKYAIKILNGSGVGGEAGRQKGNLEKEGFIVSTIGNADNSDHTDTVIQAKKEVDKDFLDKLKSVLGTSFTIGGNETLADDALTPVVVILGTKK